ncbi:MAG: DMT family transporter [Kiritimatiellae bacterium]|nr:DMT family transporter [Kiritimatiellia bacterium]
MGKREPGLNIWAVLCLVVAVCCYGSVPLFLRYFSTRLDPWTVNGFRYSIASIIWLPVVIILSKRVPRGRSVWKDALVPAAINICGQILWALLPYKPFDNDASVTGFAVRSSFLFTILFGFCVSKGERSLAGKKVFWIGVAASVAGLVLLSAASLSGKNSTPLGMFMIILTAVFWGAYGVAIHSRMKPYSPVLSFGVISMYTAGSLIVCMLIRGNPSELAGLDGRNILLLVLSAVFGIAISHVLLYRVIKDLGPVVTSGGTMAAPFVTVVGAMLFLNETMTSVQWAGGLLVVVSGILLVMAKKDPTFPLWRRRRP